MTEAKRQSYIRRVYRTVRHPLDALERWRKRRAKIARTGSLQHFARIMQEKAKTARSRAKWKAIRWRYHRKLEYLRAHKDDPVSGDGIAYFDGKPVAAWIKPWLEKSRNNGWRGYLVSGYRTPEYSQSLCYAMCGAPSCPGRCAGTSSNHTRLGPGQGAVDVTDPYNFQAIQYRIGSPLRNNLSGDRVHFSTSGV